MPILLLSDMTPVLVDESDHRWLLRHDWHNNGRYAYTRIDGRSVYMHRLIMGGAESLDIDHRNGCGYDNRRLNLREGTHAQNIAAQNRKPPKSGFRGVAWNPRAKSWHARITVNYKPVSLGYHKDLLQAARAYDEAARHYFGEFAYQNLK